MESLRSTIRFTGAALLALLVVVPSASAVTNDCLTQFDGVPDADKQGGSFACTDGDSSCDTDSTPNQCTFNFSVCSNQPGTGCTAAEIKKVSVKRVNGKCSVSGLKFTPNGSTATCGTSTGVVVKTKKKGKKAGKCTIQISAKSTTKPRQTDKNKLILTCNPAGTLCPDGSQPPCQTVTKCPKNTAGGPDQLVFTILGQGTDLDNGWTGTSHNFPVIKDATTTFCLQGCDQTSNPMCTANGPTGANSVNGQFFGPPLPLIAGGVPVCVINRFSGDATGMGNIQTGEMNGLIPLFSDVFATDATRVCPQCLSGTCDSGSKRGVSCHVDGSVVVANSLATNKNFQLSKDCPPLGNPLSTLVINLPITTGTIGTPGTGGSKPCREKEAQGVPVKDNNCSGGCGQGNCTGLACVSKIADPSNPAQMICVDSKGGLSQACCNDNTTVPCFDTGTGGIGIQRTGRAVAPTPAFPDPTYPKTAEGVVTVATFCEAATGSSNIDTVTGLPGPGAVIFNNHAEWSILP